MKASQRQCWCRTATEGELLAGHPGLEREQAGASSCLKGPPGAKALHLGGRQGKLQ